MSATTLHRYFIDIAYKGSNYKGLQKQPNAISIEGELLHTLNTYYKKNPLLSFVSASRTDAGVHAKKNTFHFDVKHRLDNTKKDTYHLNAMLSNDIVILHIYSVQANAHARFDAQERIYNYTLSLKKNPFIEDFSMLYPYDLDRNILKASASMILHYKDFTSFCKKHNQNFTYHCNIIKSEWQEENDLLIYKINADRFLRGMIRALVGSMLLVGRKKITLDEFENLFKIPKIASADFSPKAKGLCLMNIIYPEKLLLIN